MCLQAHRLGMKYPKYLFLTYGSYESQWWTLEDDEKLDDCSPKDRAEVLQFSLAALHYPPLRRNVTYVIEDSGPRMVRTLLL